MSEGENLANQFLPQSKTEIPGAVFDTFPFPPAAVQEIQGKVGREFNKILSENPALRQSMIEMSDALAQQAERGVALLDQWDSGGVMNRLKVAPQLAKVMVFTSFGQAMLTGVLEHFQQTAVQRVRENSTFSPEQSKELIDRLLKSGVLDTRG